MMAKRRKGIKRHETLKPLSRHHMIGLHLALKFKRAGTKESRLTLEEIIEDAREFWVPDGYEHFREEEEVLLPAYSEYGDINDSEIVTMLVEHVLIRAGMIKLLEENERDIEKMHELGKLLEQHIRREERIIFPMIEKTLPEDKLEELAPYLH